MDEIGHKIVPADYFVPIESESLASDDVESCHEMRVPADYWVQIFVLCILRRPKRILRRCRDAITP